MGSARESMAQETPKKITPTPSMHFLSQVFEVRVDIFWTGRRWCWILFFFFFFGGDGGCHFNISCLAGCGCVSFQTNFCKLQSGTTYNWNKSLGKITPKFNSEFTPAHLPSQKERRVFQLSIFRGCETSGMCPQGYYFVYRNPIVLTLQWMRFDPGICQNSAGNCGKYWDRNGSAKKNLGGDTPTVEHAKINSEMDW